MKKARCWIVLMLMVLALFILNSFVFAQDDNDKFARETLRGLKGVSVLVETLDPEIKRNGLAEDQLRTDVELKLRMAGIKVLSGEQSYLTGSPCLYVSAIILKSKYQQLYIYNVRVQLRQTVSLVRAPNIKDWAATWSVHLVGFTPKLKTTRESLKDFLDEFINAYLSVNPK